MNNQEVPQSASAKILKDAARIVSEKILNPESLNVQGGMTSDMPVLVILVAGKGTRFGKEPKCIQQVHGMPLARHSIDAFHRFSQAPAICLVGYRYNEVSAALGTDNTYILSDNPAGGTAFAAFESFCIPDLVEKNPLLIITMGDRIVPSSVFRRLYNKHCEENSEADLTFLTAIYEPPKNSGKGRVLRDENGEVVRIVEERDIVAEKDIMMRQALLNLTEGNCPLYIIRAATLYQNLLGVTNNNAQGQFYLTDIIESICNGGGDVRTITTKINDPEYDLLCSDVTQPMDLALLEGILSSKIGLLIPEELEVEEAAKTIMAGRTAGQVKSIARQLGELHSMVRKENLAFEPGKPLGIGISGGRLRIAFMHPDMVRFYGPAWQMPIGAENESGDDQIVVFIQSADDGRIHLVPMNQTYRENIDYVAADYDAMYPGEEVSDFISYEKFGTKMSEGLLLSLGYFSDEELKERRKKNLPLPPPTLWVSSNMRRPFALVGNAIASLRTLRTGNLGAKVQEHLGIANFRGLRLVSTGNIPQGGFSSSSAVTVATKNAINSLYSLGLSPDLMVQLACQAEYGTGVRAGSLDQATEQKGISGEGTLISSNPKDNYCILGTYPIPDERFRITFPYSVERDRDAWRWSCGAYSETTEEEHLTTTEIRKLTGKAAEIAALLVRLPLDTDFFKHIEDDLVKDGMLDDENREWVCSVLLKLPLLINRQDLQKRLYENLDWYAEQLMGISSVDKITAMRNAENSIRSLFEGWRDPVMRRTTASGTTVEEKGIPLRAMVAYLFGEVAKNFYLIHNPDKWIDCISRSQRGDCSYDINPDNLPSADDMEKTAGWEKGYTGPQLMNMWLDRFGATPFNFNSGLDDETLSKKVRPEFYKLEGSSFFRGLALIDLAEAMLKKAFGRDAVAVRVNAAGQGDYFQVHIDTKKADVEDVKRFIHKSFYRRFGLSPEPEFVSVHSGGGAAGVRLSRYDLLPQLIQRLTTQK
ncbi:MAG TPA: NTP transferase domain-containing protein [Bacteroidales bacterium]|nr:NTP transferase domain-containing protein [Bacteroidales bacterium]HPT20840.1 NTP transferase domain-containing protein [Bacteroidales bacterium]